MAQITVNVKCPTCGEDNIATVGAVTGLVKDGQIIYRGQLNNCPHCTNNYSVQISLEIKAFNPQPIK